MPVIDMKATGENIKKFMEEKDITVTEMYKILGFVSGQAIYRWLRGESLPKIDNLVIVASVLDAKIDDILVMNE